jgi:rieske iron-sulfur protein
MTKYSRMDPEISRRKFVSVAIGGTAAVGVGSLAFGLAGVNPPSRLTPAKLPVVEGDVLVHALKGAKYGTPITPADLSEKSTTAWPMRMGKDGKPIIKDAEPNNLLIVFKFPEAKLQAPTDLKGTVQGIVAYSDICQHLGCQVGDNASKPGTLLCPCHSGAYDPAQGCKVIGGPPPRPLPQLPIKLDGDKIVATNTLEEPYFGAKETDWKALVEEAKKA